MSLVCGVTGLVLFGSCPVSTCMWSDKQGGCNRPQGGYVHYDSPHQPEDQDLDPKSRVVAQKIRLTIAIGTFIERNSTRSIFDVREKDIPSFAAFADSRYGKAFPATTIEQYAEIIEQIKQSL